MKRKLILIASILTLSFSASPSVRAQWVQTGVPYGCPVTCFANGSPTIFAGTDWGGVYSTSDHGTTWVPDNNGLMALDLDVQALVISGSNIFAGTQSDNSETGGVFRSTNQGLSWVSMNTGLPGTAIYSLAASDTNLFVSTSKGVFLSTNNGANWTAVNNSLTNNSSPVTAFATIGSTLFAVSGYVFRSTNNGMSWTNESSGLFGAVQGVITTIGASGTNLFVGESGGYGGVFISTDSGASWTLANTGLPPIGFGLDVCAFATVGTNVFVGTNSGVYRTTNNGESWTSVGLENIGNNAWVQPLAVCDSELFAGTTIGDIFDSGAVWHRPLSQMINTSAVAPASSAVQSIAAYPNPCTSSSTIAFSCASSGTGEVTILNLLGAEVARVYEGELSAGEHSFTWDASGAAPGMYECVVRVNGNVQRTELSHLK